ncbi:PRD domain-containing protein [Trichococcus patagoniensis]|uniref:PRD domain-containing protein n=1 Tax=Trichococcus patagoniensis TaxID=382641 RepID=UPI00147594ED|nr:PRD domain-containing protein [Trichococcus patagoniensis]
MYKTHLSIWFFCFKIAEIKEEGVYVRFRKVLNNNAVLAVDNDGKEYVIFSRGIAFDLKKDQEIPEERIDRIFFSGEKNSIQELLETIPQNYFDLSCEIIEFIQKNLQTKISNSIYITLMDHISFLKERAQNGMLLKNALKWEIKNFYPEEYRVSKKIVELLEDELEVTLNDDEVASIALHIINAQMGNSSIQESIKYVQLVDDIIQIIFYQTNKEIHEEDLIYQRLATHVKFFVKRIYQMKDHKTQDNLNQPIKNSFPKAYEISKKITEFVEKKVDCKISDEEISYLAIHIQRVLIY